ncbi:MAG: M15 family metallopeptidase [Treponema sp.]|nr:M15 family metallopeptidase [Treponema sp.]
MLKNYVFIIFTAVILLGACVKSNNGRNQDHAQEQEEVQEQDHFLPQAVEPLSEEIIKKITGKSYKDNASIAYSDLVYLTIPYINFNGESCVGNMIVAAHLGKEVLDIFQELYENRFPIYKMQLIDYYDADDNLSMEDNNTSAFNYRYIANTARISNHGYGIAIDINPVQNPYITNYAILPPAGTGYLDRGYVRKGMIVKGDVCYRAFISRGWTWGGDWSTPKDYQHFEKR